MRDMLIQSVRQKLQKRVCRLNASNLKSFRATLTVFLGFLESSPLLAGVRDELLARVKTSNMPITIETILNTEAAFGSTEDEVAAIGFFMLGAVSK